MNAFRTKYKITISPVNHNNIKLLISENDKPILDRKNTGGQSVTKSIDKGTLSTITKELSYLIVKEIKKNPDQLKDFFFR